MIERLGSHTTISWSMQALDTMPARERATTPRG
jgi:hypothetical protein